MQCYFNGFGETEIQHRNIVQNLEHTRKQVILLKTLAKMAHCYFNGETAQCYFNGFGETEIQHRNIVQNLEHTRKQVILLKTLAKQRNAISMGLAKQKFSIQTRRNLEHISGSKYYCLKHWRNSAMLFQWVWRNKNSVLLNTVFEGGLSKYCVETV